MKNFMVHRVDRCMERYVSAWSAVGDRWTAVLSGSTVVYQAMEATPAVSQEQQAFHGFPKSKE